MWIVYAFGSAFFAGITSILVKSGINKTSSTIATAIRTVVVLIVSWMIVFIVGSQNQISQISSYTLLFLVLSGIATGISWLWFFKALAIGDVNKVVPVDKSSTILSVVLALIFLQEAVTPIKVIGVVLMTIGTFMMVEKKDTVSKEKGGKSWLLYALGAAFTASLVAILGKVGISGIESNLGTAIRTGVVLIIAWAIVFITGKQDELKEIPKKEFILICISGLATGASWLLYYRALHEGLASVVVPINKLGILVTVAFSYFVFHEKLTKKSFIGLILIIIGTLMMLIT